MASQTFAFQYLLNPLAGGGYAVRDELPGTEGTQSLGSDLRVRGIGDDKKVLGSELNDQFKVGQGGRAPVYDYVGTATNANGAVVGLVGERDGILFLFTDRANLSPARELSVNPAGANGTNNWSLVTDGPVCFMPGTLIATPRGEVAVEDLRRGDLVTTSSGASEPVRWIGRQTVSRLFGDPARVLPVRIRAGALGGGLPKRDLFVSGDHALLVDGLLVQAGALVNGSSILREEDVPTVFTYLHVELSDHSLLLAEGTPAETFIDNVDRAAFDNWAEHEALSDAPAPMTELDVPRVRSARQLPPATRARLAAAAESLRPPFASVA
ncbi:Hint domain-containing protein [Roseomonas sp. CCTCC AB2023176]|uniref:Hint domain-containing protein n=1 Tax=Roseomonas sp. CCTCC AB2023176 TaxID=3342640 RepID=UPI0035DE532F